jgi:hypothetical protein
MALVTDLSQEIFGGHSMDLTDLCVVSDIFKEIIMILR